MLKNKMLDAEIFVVENAQKYILGDGSEGSEGKYDTEWAYNS